MSAAGESSRSIAVELALLFLRELEPRSQKIRSGWSRPRRYSPLQRSGAGIPLTWQHWRRILEKYEKADLIEHMLGEPMRRGLRAKASPLRTG